MKTLLRGVLGIEKKYMLGGNGCSFAHNLITEQNILRGVNSFIRLHTSHGYPSRTLTME